MWSETVTSFDDLALLLLPRLALVADRAWSRTDPDPAEIRRRVRRSAKAWHRLGLHNFYRSTSLFKVD